MRGEPVIDSIGVPMASRKRRILVIEDDDSVADTLAMVLNFSAFEATAVYSGEQALDLARELPYDHIVPDVMMEPMNGIQAAITIQAICPEFHAAGRSVLMGATFDQELIHDLS